MRETGAERPLIESPQEAGKGTEAGMTIVTIVMRKKKEDEEGGAGTGEVTVIVMIMTLKVTMTENGVGGGGGEEATVMTIMTAMTVSMNGKGGDKEAKTDKEGVVSLMEKIRIRKVKIIVKAKEGPDVAEIGPGILMTVKKRMARVEDKGDHHLIIPGTEEGGKGHDHMMMMRRRMRTEIEEDEEDLHPMMMTMNGTEVEEDLHLMMMMMIVKEIEKEEEEEAMTGEEIRMKREAAGLQVQKEMKLTLVKMLKG